MIECNPLTLEASSLKTRTCSLGLSKSRRSERPADMSEMITSTLKGSPSMLMGHPIGVHVSSSRSGGTTHPRLLSGDAFSVLCPACYKGGKL